jgi:hypothetical protein
MTLSFFSEKEVINMSDTKIIRRLKDYKGFHIWKDHTVKGEIYYYLCDPEEDEIIDVFRTLKDVKKAADRRI